MRKRAVWQIPPSRRQCTSFQDRSTSFDANGGALVNSLFLGFAIMFPVAFVVVYVATKSVSIALAASMTIAAIVWSVLGGAYLAGEELGVLLSVAGIIVIGFSVDYTVHFGIVFLEAPEIEGKSRREDRYKAALGIMGSTVIAGAITTAAAGLAMLPCVMSLLCQDGGAHVVYVLFDTVHSTVKPVANLLIFNKVQNTTCVTAPVHLSHFILLSTATPQPESHPATIAASLVFSLFVFLALCLFFGPGETAKHRARRIARTGREEAAEKSKRERKPAVAAVAPKLPQPSRPRLPHSRGFPLQ